MGTTRRYILLSLFKASDLALQVSSFIAAAVPSLKEVGAISLSDFLSMRISVRNFALFSGLLLLWHCLFYSFGLYESNRLARQRSEAVDVLKVTSIGTFALFLVGSLFNLSVIHPLFLTVFSLVSTRITVSRRLLLRVILASLRKRARNLRNVVSVGTHGRALEFARRLVSRLELGYRVARFVDQSWHGTEIARRSDYAVASDFGDFPEFLRNKVVDEVALV